MKNSFLLYSLLIGILLSLNPVVMAQLTSGEAGYIDAVDDFGADNTGSSVTTAALQNAINSAISQQRPLFIPAGTYLVDGTLTVENDGDRGLQNVLIQGSCTDPDKRTVLLLKEGTFPSGTGYVIENISYNNSSYPNTFNRIIQSINVKIGKNNAGAVGMNWRGAEGCAIFDVHIDATGGKAGFYQMPGSGGSAANISVKGGRIGIEIPFDGAQPSPTITDMTLEGQTEAAISASGVRGALTITGAVIHLAKGVPAIRAQRANFFQQGLGDNLVLTDCVIEYDSTSTENQAVAFPSPQVAPCVYFSNVYVKNAAGILHHTATINSNPDGWTHFTEMAYNSGEFQGIGFGIYINGEEQGNVYAISSDAEEPPFNIQSRHSWGKTFPSFETPGAVNIKNFGSDVDDWSQAINQAIEAAAGNGSNVVFVPVGDYKIRNTIDLLPKTKLIGAGFRNSRILGVDDASHRFGGSTNSWTDPKPMVSTPDDKNATCILADLGIHPYSTYDNIDHTPEARAEYSVLWRAGNYSVIRNIDYHAEKGSDAARYRAAWALAGANNTGSSGLQTPEWLNLRTLPSPSTIGQFIFSSECSTKYHTAPTVPSRLLLETVDGSRRLMTRSMPPGEFNGVKNNFDIPNLTLSKAGDKPFSLTSLDISHSSWNPNEGTTIQIIGFGNTTDTVTIDMAGFSRKDMQTVSLNWDNITKTVITSEVPFSIDNIVSDGSTIDFEDQVGEPVQENVDYHHWSSGYGYMYLPMYEMASPYVLITHGCRYYNHWIHGSNWLRITEPYLKVSGNDPDDIVSIYHSHAQHSQNFYKFLIENAYNVTLYGVKTENNLELARAVNSKNIRFMGHGGMTNPPKGASHYHFINCTDYECISPTDEVYTEDRMINGGLGDAMLPGTKFGTYDVIQDEYNGKVYTPAKTDRPILWKRGNPGDPWQSKCDAPRTLSINHGQKTVQLCPGQQYSLNPENDECSRFVQWSGDTEFIDDTLSGTTFLTMPDKDIEVDVIFEPLPEYTVEVTNGTGSGTYCSGRQVTITADQPDPGKVFQKWSGDIQALADSVKPVTSVTIYDTDIHISAVYVDVVRAFNDTNLVIPGIIPLEEFDRGGEGFAYHDTDPSATGIFRPEDGVDINETETGSKDYFIGWIEPGEWIEYSLSSLDSIYDVDIYYASAENGGSFTMKLDGISLTGEIAVEGTGGWKTFDSIKIDSLRVLPGEHILRLDMTSNGFNLDKMVFTKNEKQTSVITDIPAGKVVDIYPNPSANGIFFIRLLQPVSKAQISIYDLTGRCVYNKTFQFSQDKNHTFSIHHKLNKGIYLASVLTDHLSETTRIVIE